MACIGTGPLAFTCPATRLLGRGVAVEIACPGLVALRTGLASAWTEGWRRRIVRVIDPM